MSQPVGAVTFGALRVAQVVRIPLRARDGSVRAYALIEAADAAVTGVDRGRRWYLHSAGYACRRNSPEPMEMMHRVIMGLAYGDGLEVDHINGDRLDNRRSNLRVVAGRENRQNRHDEPRAQSGIRGVSLHRPSGLWTASVHVNGRTIRTYHKTVEKAAEGVRELRRIHHPFSPEQ